MVTGCAQLFPGFLRAGLQLHRGGGASCWTNSIQAMKTDYSFKLVAAIVIAGVFVAFASSSHPLHSSENAAPGITQAANHTE
jgi:hypothetical protein